MSPSYVSRINQLDALQLDEEIHRIFSSRAQEISRLFAPGIADRWSPEISASLRSLIWLFSLGSGKSTFGQKLLDLTYADLTPKKSIILLILTVLPKYLEDKFIDPNRIPITQRDKSLKKYLEKINNFLTLMNFINLLIFLNRGTQPIIFERVLGISSRNVASTQPRTIGYSYMTRELLWHGLMELFTTGLPMVNFHYFKRFIGQLFQKKQSGSIETVPSMTITTLCPYCNETPILPRHAGCRHIYCYYCINAHFTIAESFNCVACGTQLHLRNMKVYVVAPSCA